MREEEGGEERWIRVEWFVPRRRRKDPEGVEQYRSGRLSALTWKRRKKCADSEQPTVG